MPHQILALTVSAQPHSWLSPEEAIHAKVGGKILYGFGDHELVFRGGVNRAGVQSTVSVEPIVVLAGSELAKFASGRLPLTNDILFGRDRYLCAYCGQRFARRDLTRDHVIPRVQGGPDVFTNCLSACRACNSRKGGRTPEQAGMLPLFVPYVPVRAEGILLEGRNILACQMEILQAQLPKHSRLLNEGRLCA